MKKNVAGQKVYFSLFKAGARIANPTIAVGDWKVDLAGAGQNNVATPPTSDAAGLVTWSPSQAETNADYVTLLGVDAAGAEWEPLTISFPTEPDTSIASMLAGVHLDATQPAITWAQQKIIANVAGEGAFDIRNADAAGYGLYTAGVYAQYNNASGPGSIGTYNIGEGIGQRNTGSGGASFGQFNSGGQTGLFADGASDYGIQAQGGTADLDPAFPAAGDPWSTALPGAYAAGTAGYQLAKIFACGCGTGATQVTYVLTDSGTGLPIADADIWVTTDAAGANTIAAGQTDVLGEVEFWLDSGVTYYVWRQKDGFTFVNPDIEAVP